ncbi:hypothetical protein BDZ97DRAFT_1792341, partial [Flammula alnicola]
MSLIQSRPNTILPYPFAKFSATCLFGFKVYVFESNTIKYYLALSFPKVFCNLLAFVWIRGFRLGYDVLLSIFYQCCEEPTEGWRRAARNFG